MGRDLVERRAEPQYLVGFEIAERGEVSATSGVPMVSVPVLSNGRTRPRASASSAPPPLTMIPRLAAREIRRRSRSARPAEHGHGVATTNTESARTGSPLIAHANPAIPKVTGMKIIAYRSARRTNGAFSFCACSTSRTMPA